MNIKQKLKELEEMKARCERENRNPTASEVRKAERLIEEIELEEVGRFFSSGSGPEYTQITSPNGPFETFGEQLIAIRNAELPGGRIDRRLHEVTNLRAATGLQEAVPSDGGFLVQDDFANQLLINTWNNSELLRRVNTYEIAGNANSLKINGFDENSRADGSRAGGIRGYWADEAAEKTASKPKFRQIELTLHKLIGLCYATDELLEDANALDKALRDGFRAEFDFKLADAIINGSGAGRPLGVLNAGSIVSVTKETGQAADTIVWENIVKMYARLKVENRKSVAWVINKDIIPELYSMSLAVGTGGVPVFMPAGGASGLPYNTLMGLPIIESEAAATLGDTGDIILGDWSQYVMARKGGTQMDVSIHVRFVYDESCYRWVLRVDGQPTLASAITPYKGTDTVSHFVKLDARD